MKLINVFCWKRFHLQDLMYEMVFLTYQIDLILIYVFMLDMHEKKVYIDKVLTLTIIKIKSPFASQL